VITIQRQYDGLIYNVLEIKNTVTLLLSSANALRVYAWIFRVCHHFSIVISVNCHYL